MAEFELDESNQQAKVSAEVVMSQLVDSLVKHYLITRADARKIIREVLMEL